MGVSFVEVDRPWRIVEAGRGGKYNRIRSMTIYSLEPGAEGTTRVQLSVETVPATITDRLMEMFGARTLDAPPEPPRAAAACGRSSRTARAAARARRSPAADE